MRLSIDMEITGEPLASNSISVVRSVESIAVTYVANGQDGIGDFTSPFLS